MSIKSSTKRSTKRLSSPWLGMRFPSLWALQRSYALCISRRYQRRLLVRLRIEAQNKKFQVTRLCCERNEAPYEAVWLDYAIVEVVLSPINWKMVILVQ